MSLSDPDAELLALALLGSRMGGFNHDLASKLQSLLMGMDELEELVADRGDAELTGALEGVRGAAEELASVLTESRALVRGTLARPSVAALVQAAAAQVGVMLTGELDPQWTSEVAHAPVLQALALALDVAAGAGRQRSLAVSGAVRATMCELVVTCVTPPTVKGTTLLGIARGALTATGGALALEGATIRIELPLLR